MPHPTTIRSGTYLTSLALVLCMLFVACGHDSLLDEEIADAGGTEDTGIFAWLMLPPKPVDDCRGLGKWLDKYGERFNSRVERPGFVLEASYRPAACTACMEERGSVFADSAFRQRVAQLKATEFYVLKVTVGKNEQDTLFLELSDILIADLIEVVGRDTFPCSFMHVEAVPSSLPYRSALVGFDRPQDGRDRYLVLRDREGHFGGDLNLVFPEGSMKAYLTIAPDTLTSPRS